MNPQNTSLMNIIVIGDVTIDWNLARTQTKFGNERSGQRGEFTLLTGLVSQMIIYSQSSYIHHSRQRRPHG